MINPDGVNPLISSTFSLLADFSPQRGNNSGFTLLEVMAAVAILTVTFLGLLTLQNQTVSLSINAKNLTIASLVAKEAYVEKELELRGFTAITDRTRRMRDAYPAFEVAEPEILPLELPLGRTPPYPLFLIKIRVGWKVGETSKEFSLTGITAPGIYGEKNP